MRTQGVATVGFPCHKKKNSCFMTPKLKKKKAMLLLEIQVVSLFRSFLLVNRIPENVMDEYIKIEVILNSHFMITKF